MMKLSIYIPDYDGRGTDVIWEDDADYDLSVSGDSVVLRANRSGFISLARQMLYFAYQELPKGSHVHYDEFFTGRPHEYELIVEELNNEISGK